MKKFKKPVSLLLSFVLIFSLFTIIPVSAAETDGEAVGGDTRTITYIENDGKTATQSGCIKLTNTTEVLEEGKWYYAEEEIENWKRIKAEDNAHLILLNGTNCNLYNGINVPHIRYNNWDDYGEIHIYAQSKDKNVMGKLYARGYGDNAAIGSNRQNRDAGEIEINGGWIEAEAYTGDGAAIGGGGCYLDWRFTVKDITINDGYVYATAKGKGCGIGAGTAGKVDKITINGGTVVAKSAKGNGIGAGPYPGGSWNTCGTIKINGGDVTAIGARNAIGPDAFSDKVTQEGYTENYAFTSGKVEKSDDVQIVVPMDGYIHESKKYVVDPANTKDQTGHAKTVRFIKNPVYYDVNINTVEHGTVELDKYQSVVGDTVTLSVYPDPSYVIGSVSVTDDETSEPIALTDKGNGKYSFTMPNNAVTVSATFEYKTPAQYWEGSGTADDPYLIKTSDDWAVLTTAYGYYNDCFKLMRNLTVSTFVGGSDHPFTGVFDGNEKKLTLNLSSNNKEIFAPFIKTDGNNTVIKNLLVAGNISFLKKTGSALVGTNSGKLTIENCRVNATLTSTVDGEGNIGGFVGFNESGGTLTFAGCAFAGKLLGDKTKKCGGFDGLSGGTVKLNDSVFVPEEVTLDDTDCANFVYAAGSSTVNVDEGHVFSRSDFGTTKQGKRGYYVYSDGSVELDFKFDPDSSDPEITEYNVSGIKTYNADNIFFDGKYMENMHTQYTLFKIIIPEDTIYDHLYFDRDELPGGTTLEEWYEGCGYYGIKTVNSDTKVGARDAHTVTKHPKVEPGINHYGVEEYWECTDCGAIFSAKDINSETTEDALVIPPTNACRAGEILSVGKDIFFTKGSKILNITISGGYTYDITDDTVDTVDYDSETGILSINSFTLSKVKSYDGWEFTGELYVFQGGTGKSLQIYPLYHSVDEAQPVWDWNGHYSATATLTGFAYFRGGEQPVTHTQTIDAQITYRDTEVGSEYTASSRIYTATAVTPGKTFTDTRTEPLAPERKRLENGELYKIEEAIDVTSNCYIKNTNGEDTYNSFNNGAVLTVHYDKENTKLYLTKNNADYTADVAEIKNNDNFSFTGYFYVKENSTQSDYFELIPIYHYNFRDAAWIWSEDHLDAQATVSQDWYYFKKANDYFDQFTAPFSVTIDADVETTYNPATAESDGSHYYNAKATLCDCVFTDQHYELIEKGTADTAGYSISLDGDIGVNFYMALSDKIITDRNVAYMQFTVPSGDSYSKQRVFVSDADIKKVGAKKYYVFKCKVAAKDMASTITAQIIDGNDYYNIYSYSVREYAKFLLDNKDMNRDYEKAAPIVTAMLNYGAAAQRYFGVNTNDLANSILDEEDRVYRAYTDFEVAQSDDDLPKGVFEGATLSLKSKTTLSIYFKSDEPLTFSCEGKKVEKAEADGYQIARIRDIPAVELSDSFTLTVNGQYEVHYSPLNYCKLVLTSDSTSNTFKDVAGALYTYSHLADYYFGKTQPDPIPDPED